MPELPEVETVRLQLLHKVVGKTIAAVEVFHSKTVGYDETIEDRLVGNTIAGVDRVGKLLIFSFTKDPDLHLLAHLKMTGQFIYVDTAGAIDGGGHTLTETDVAQLPGRHTRVSFRFTDASLLYFNDMRLFGYTRVADAAAVLTERGKYGPEPIADDFDCEWFATKVRTRKAPIKAVLLDQSFVAGLGNIYVDEALWRARVRPSRPANKLTLKQAATLCVAAGDVMKESIALGGTTFRNFIDTGGKNGNFTDRLQVFGKQGSSCPRCESEITKTRVAGRGTHFCPGCQR